MSARYQAYPEYKPSGVEWLDEIPTGWGRAPMKYMALEEGSLFLDGDWIESKDLSDEGIRYITTGNVGEGAYKEQGAGYISDKTFRKIDANEVFEGDILVSRLNAPIGRACVVPDLSNRIVTSVDNVVFRPDEKFHRPYVVYMLSSREYFSHTANMARGATMQRISRGLLGNIRIVYPPLPEQTQIAAFLDHETAQIDALIAKQQRLIELLEEKRQAVISHAVTKGLNPDAPLRPSGIVWLGDVPEHWEVKQLKYVCSSIGTGSTPKSQDDLTENGPVPWYTPGDFDGRLGLNYAKKRLEQSPIANGDAKLFSPNSVLIVGIGATLGKVSVCETPFSCNQQINIATPTERNDVHFLASALMSQHEQMRTVANSATIGIMNQEKTGSILVAIPPRSEQIEIANFIRVQEGAFQVVCSKAQSAITLLKERRTALISAAVTGKIDVRDWQSPKSISDSTPDISKDAFA